MKPKSISVYFLFASLLWISACNMRGDNPTSEQMMKRADSIDSLANLREMEIFRADSEHVADSASAAADYQKYHENLEVEQAYP